MTCQRYTFGEPTSDAEIVYPGGTFPAVDYPILGELEWVRNIYKGVSSWQLTGNTVDGSGFAGAFTISTANQFVSYRRTNSTSPASSEKDFARPAQLTFDGDGVHTVNGVPFAADLEIGLFKDRYSPAFSLEEERLRVIRTSDGLRAVCGFIGGTLLAVDETISFNTNPALLPGSPNGAIYASLIAQRPGQGFSRSVVMHWHAGTASLISLTISPSSWWTYNGIYDPTSGAIIPGRSTGEPSI